MAEHPNQHEVGEQMLAQLHRIQAEFEGETRERLVALVAETFESHQQILSWQATSLEAIERLTQLKVQSLAMKAAAIRYPPAKKLLN